MPARRRPDYGETLYCVEYAKSNRSTCKSSGEKIEKDELRIGSTVPGEGDYDMTSWRKLPYVTVPLVVSEEETWTEASQIFGFDELPAEGQALVEAMMAKGKAAAPSDKKKGKAAASASADEPAPKKGKGKGKAKAEPVEEEPPKKGKAAGKKRKGKEVVEEEEEEKVKEPPKSKKAKASEAKEEDLDPATLGKMTVPNLKKALAERGLEETGKKAELVERLKTSIEEKAAAKTEDKEEDEPPRTTEKGTLIDCPFKERDTAEQLGAVWDFRAKKWCVPFTKALEPFAKWLDAATLAANAPLHSEKPAAAPPAAKEDKPTKKEGKAAAGPSGSSGGGGGGGGGRRVDRAVERAAAAAGVGGGGWSVHADYDIKLMQADVKDGRNNNKFYVIQVLQSSDGSYAAFNRWGRVGEEGECKLYPSGDAGGAVKAFEAKFKDKTKNSWAAYVAGSFVKNEGSGGKYGILELDGGGGDEDGGDAPLGKLSEGQILKGIAVLGQLSAAVGGGEASPAQVSKLSSEYYTFIPTMTGRKAPPPLDNLEILGAKEAQLLFWLKMGFEGVATIAPSAAAKSQVDDPLEALWETELCATLQKACGVGGPGVSDAGSIASSVARGKELAKAQQGAPLKKMDAQRYGSIVLYTGNSLYRPLNRALREDHAQVPKYLGYLRLLFEAMVCMPSAKTTLWRGIAADLYDEYEPGKVITWWSVSSCTSDEAVARNFMSQLGGAASLIVLKCKTAMDITPLSVYPNEKESLLAPGTRLKVLSRTKKGKVNEIHVEEVGGALDGK